MDHPFPNSSKNCCIKATKSTHDQTFSLGDWHNNSCVRSRINLYDNMDDWETESVEREWLPLKMIPFLEQPCFLRLPKAVLNKIAAKHLVYFLDYTTKL